MKNYHFTHRIKYDKIKINNDRSESIRITPCHLESKIVFFYFITIAINLVFATLTPFDVWHRCVHQLTQRIVTYVTSLFL